MGSILDRFTTIMKSNVNALLDKWEDPAKMIDQTLVDMKRDLAEVRKETASVRGNARTANDKVTEQEEKIAKYELAINNAAKIIAANPDDATARDEAKRLIEKKKAYEAQLPQLRDNARIASDNAEKITQMHDKLQGDIEILEARRTTIKAKAETAKTIKHVSKVMTGTKNASSAMETFDRMEEKANRDFAEAEESYNLSKRSESTDLLADKYASAMAPSDTDAELDALVAQYSKPADSGAESE